jgi:S1-C subfamily serine protease
VSTDIDTQTSAAAFATISVPMEIIAPTSTPPAKVVSTLKATVQKVPQKSQKEAVADTPGAVRIQNPYPTSPLSFTDINTTARLSLVNIFCIPHGGSLRPISGSGVIIDPRGVILTNAHVAQYVLLSETPKVNLSCFVRTGSPALPQWIPEVLYIPPTWVATHASDITSAHPVGTGEHDYALLYIPGSIDGMPLPPSFPAVSPDTREAIAFVDDPVLAAGYPAEFAGGSVQTNLFPVSSVTSVKQFFTFGSGTPDVISIGSVIEAQSGSSGGPVVNAWGRLVGIITTTSDGATTADRELRAITASYINHDLFAQSGLDLSAIPNGDLVAQTNDFTNHQAPALIQLFLEQITK